MHIPSIKELTKNMVEVGLITSDQLETAMNILCERGGDLGQILISEGFITEDVFVAFLGKKSDITYISLADYGEIDKKVTSKVPESVARRKNLIPIKMDNNTLTIAISDPMDVFAIDDIKAITGMKIDIVLAVKDDIKKAIEKNYESEEDFFDDMDSTDDQW
ncbi:hypothetical protein ACFLUV_01880 [Elusimicrobiota bacterium]